MSIYDEILQDAISRLPDDFTAEDLIHEVQKDKSPEKYHVIEKLQKIQRKDTTIKDIKNTDRIFLARISIIILFGMFLSFVFTIENNAAEARIINTTNTTNIMLIQKITEENIPYISFINTTDTNIKLSTNKNILHKGENIRITLSIVNLVSNPSMQAQLILMPPITFDVTSSNTFTGGNQYSSSFILNQSQERSIEIEISSTQTGNFTIYGRTIYFQNNKFIEDHTLEIPIKVIN